MKPAGKFATIFFTVFCINYFTACGGTHRPLLPTASESTLVNNDEKSGQTVPGFDSVKGIFEKRCVGCHTTNGKANFSIYEQAKAKSSLIKGKLLGKLMPQPGSEEASAFTNEEKQTILAWIASGANKESKVISGPDETTPPVGDITDGTLPPPTMGSKLDSCIGCHGINKGSSNITTPNLAGLSKDYLTSQLKRFKLKLRRNPTMETIAADLSDEDIEFITSAYSGLARVQYTDEKEINEKFDSIMRGKKIVATCAGCHSPSDSSMGIYGLPKPSGEIEYVPVLRGQRAEYISAQLHNFSVGEMRFSSMMAGILASQPPGLIKFDESGKAISHPVKDPETGTEYQFPELDDQATLDVGTYYQYANDNLNLQLDEIENTIRMQAEAKEKDLAKAKAEAEAKAAEETANKIEVDQIKSNLNSSLDTLPKESPSDSAKTEDSSSESPPPSTMATPNSLSSQSSKITGS